MIDYVMIDFSFFKQQRKATGGTTDKKHIITTNNVMKPKNINVLCLPVSKM